MQRPFMLTDLSSSNTWERKIENGANLGRERWNRLDWGILSLRWEVSSWAYDLKAMGYRTSSGEHRLFRTWVH